MSRTTKTVVIGGQFRWTNDRGLIFERLISGGFGDQTYYVRLSRSGSQP